MESSKGRHQHRGNQAERRGHAFAKHPVMPTKKLQADLDRRQAIVKAEEEYLGQPPPGEDLCEVSS